MSFLENARDFFSSKETMDFLKFSQGVQAGFFWDENPYKNQTHNTEEVPEIKIGIETWIDVVNPEKRQEKPGMWVSQDPAILDSGDQNGPQS